MGPFVLLPQKQVRSEEYFMSDGLIPLLFQTRRAPYLAMGARNCNTPLIHPILVVAFCIRRLAIDDWPSKPTLRTPHLTFIMDSYGLDWRTKGVIPGP